MQTNSSLRRSGAPTDSIAAHQNDIGAGGLREKPTVIDLFCGAGGLSKGFEMAGFDVLLGIDSSGDCCESFLLNHKSSVICEDIREVEAAHVRQITGNRQIDVVAGGPPCQGFSVAGRRDPNDPRNSLFCEFVRLVRDLQPLWIVMENVTGLLISRTADGRNVIDIIEDEFRKIGYRMEHRTLLAADYGVPQKRKRVFFLGTRTEKSIIWPRPTHAKNPQQKLLDGELAKHVSVGEVLLPKDAVKRNYFHTQKMIDGFRRRKQRNKANNKGFGWQILKTDEPSYTISARYWKDGSDALVRYSPTEIRMLTERECARIQSFPDESEFAGSKRSVYAQIGNAVPPLLGRAIAEELKAIL